MKWSSYEFDVYVNDRPVYEYLHNGDIFIEGRKGSTFKMKFRNNTYQRVLVVPSVDGLSTLDGNTAHADSPGFICNANSTLEIPGWMVDSMKASQFEFKDRDASYAKNVNPTTLNTGVLSVLVFSEQLKQYYQTNTYTPPFIPTWDGYTRYPWGRRLSTDSSKNVQPGYGTSVGMSSISSSASDLSVTYDSYGSKGIVTNNEGENLGVGWGKSVDFQTNTVDFDKGNKIYQFTMYYDSRKNLERRGIILDRRNLLNYKPNPFPGIGCTPPKGWKG
jgi:hypothetical protein